MTDDLNYERDLEININELHKEWLRQPNLYYRYAEAWAEANKELGKAKRRLEVVKKEAKKVIDETFSELSFAARKGGEDVIGVKPTEASIQAWVLSQERYKEVVEEQEGAVEKATQELIDAQYEVDITHEGIKAFDERKTSLEQEVFLWGGQYFSSPKEPFDIDGDPDFVDGRIKNKVLNEASDKQRKKMQRGVKK